MIGQWFGSVGRAVATDTRGPRFNSSHCQYSKQNVLSREEALKSVKRLKKLYNERYIFEM